MCVAVPDSRVVSPHSDVLLRHKRRCHEDADVDADAQGDEHDSRRSRASHAGGGARGARGQDGPTALALAAAAVAQMERAGFGGDGAGAGESEAGPSSASSRRRRASTRGRGGKRAVEQRSPSEDDLSRSPDSRVPPTKIRRLEAWDLMSGGHDTGPGGHTAELVSSPEDEYARAVGVAAREYGVAGGGGGYQIDPRLSAGDLGAGYAPAQRLVQGYTHPSSRGESDYSRYPPSGSGSGSAPLEIDPRYHLDSTGYPVPAYADAYDRSASHSGSSGDQNRAAGATDEYGRPIGYATTSDRLRGSVGQHGYETASPMSMHFGTGVAQAQAQGYGGHGYRTRGSGEYNDPAVPDPRRLGEYDQMDAHGRRSVSSGRASGQSMSGATAAATAAAANATSHALAAKRNSSVNMEDATTLLAMAYGGFGQWSGGNVDPALANAAAGPAGPYAGAGGSGTSTSPRRVSQATGPGDQNHALSPQVHRASIASAGEVAGHTVVPDWDPRPHTGSGSGQASSGWTGGRLDGLGPGESPFQSADAASTSARTSLSKGMSMSNLVDSRIASGSGGAEVSPSLYNGNWAAAAPAVTTPGPFAGIDFARMSQAITDGWGVSHALPSCVNASLTVLLRQTALRLCPIAWHALPGQLPAAVRVRVQHVLWHGRRWHECSRGRRTGALPSAGISTTAHQL